MDAPMGDSENRAPLNSGANLSIRFSEEDIESESEVKSLDLRTICSANWAQDTKLNLTVLSDNQGHTYSMMLREFSAIGSLSETFQSWKRLLSVSLIKDKLETALGETEMIAELCTYIEQADCEKTRLQLEGDRLLEENVWLGEMKQLLRERLHKIKDKLRQVEAERDARHFIYKMRYAGQDPQPTRLRLDPAVLDGMHIEAFLSPRTKSIYNLAAKHIAEGRLDVAVAVCTQLLRDQTRTAELTEMEHAVINFLLGIVLLQKGRLRESLTNMEDALETFESNLGNKHPSLCFLLKQLAESNSEMGDLRATEEYMRRAIRSMRVTFGDNNDETTKLEMELCDVLMQLERYADAMELSSSIVSSVQSRHPVQEPIVIGARTLLARAQFKSKQEDTALAHVKKILQECFPRRDFQTIAEVVEAAEYEEEHRCTKLLDTYGEVQNSQEKELLKLLSEIYNAQGRRKAAQQIEYILSCYSQCSDKTTA
ncbi:unnamed protein product [Dicrocoelium dendriticum]|nr:unnamed protein product [Dicrocoelium dendriticum]